MRRFDLYLVRPTRYDDDGYPLQWWRSLIPSNSLACVSGLVRDTLSRAALGPDVEIRLIEIDEANTLLDPEAVRRQAAKTGRRPIVFLIGVQSNQYPRALDLARRLRADDVPVCIGGFHVSGVLSMLKRLTPELEEAQALGVSFFAGEAEEGRMDEVLADAIGPGLKPVYNFLNDQPGLEGQPVPFVDAATVAQNFSKFASFDLGRGCPYQCSFCTIINVQGRKSRYRSADDLEAIVRANAAIGVNQFFLTDDNFARNKAWESHLDRLIALRKQGLKVRLAIQVDTLTHRIPNFIEKCVKAGVDQVFLGLETINVDSLAAAKKGQNRIEEYKAMFLAWKKYPVFITCGYILGFPNDTYESILRDVKTIKQELPVDALYFNYLTPLPGSEDHKKLVDAGVWMDPDLNKYDLNHRVSHHPKMSDAEWEKAFADAYSAFYDFDHIETILKRAAGFRSNKRWTTVNRVVAYREANRLEGCAKLEAGFVRLRSRRQRRPGFGIEPVWQFYPRRGWQLFSTLAATGATYWKVWRTMRRVFANPDRAAYRDAAMLAPESVAADHLVTHARGGVEAAEHRRKVAALTTRVPAPAITG